MANRFPLIVDSSSLQIKELPANDNIDLANSGIVNVTSIGASSINVTGVVTATEFDGNLSGRATRADFVKVTTPINNPINPTGDIIYPVGVDTNQSSSQEYLYINPTGFSFDRTSNTLNSVNLNASGIVTATGGFSLGISSGGTTITSGPITTLNFVGTGNTFAIDGTTVDISISGSSGGGGGGGAGGDGTQFNTGITTTTIKSLVGIGTTVVTLPATAGQQYLVYSIFASNVATGSTESNVIGAFDFTSGYGGGQRSYFAYNVPLPPGTSVELLEKPQILNPSDRITMRSTDVSRNGVDDIIEVFVTYEEKTSTEYFGVGVSTVGLAVTTPVGIFTSSTYPSIVESIRLVNRTDSGAYPVTVDVTSGVTTTKLIDSLIVPKYASVELLDQPKRLQTNDIIKVQVDQASTIEVQISGKQITS